MNLSLISSWSGGKDSCFALMRAVAAGHRPVALLNMMNENGQISRSHGLPEEILRRQAAAMKLPLLAIPASWGDYEGLFIGALQRLKAEHGATAAVFGDIDLQGHRDWEEKVCAAVGLQALLPLWQKDRLVLVRQMLASGMRCVITSCQASLGEEFIGRELDEEVIADLIARGVCPCGENGEFHTVVTDCPLFEKPLELPSHRVLRHGDYLFAEWAID